MITGIPVLGEVYKVVVKRLDGDIHGTMDGDKKLIEIDTKSTDIRGTLVHETLHAILHEAGLRNVLEAGLEEAVVVALENGLMKSGLIRKLKFDL